jgi:uncharacterized membrane protein
MSPERLVSRVLLLGGLVSVTVLVGGLVIYAAAAGTGQETTDLYRSLTLEQTGRPVAVYSTLADIAHAITRERPDPLAIIALGLVLLVATPVASLVAAMVAFARAGDRDYAVIAAIVLGVLLVSFTLSGGVG